ncbi:sensor histidine kinase [Planctomicrobium sp. SH664]|uniref:sensor histidine kinase n=1 Tax=Planctomicrobium sp. SH664 TaxID=3448125 RepID=UPI003F5C7DB5
MSYRTFKKLLGENSLERKCRLLFGLVLAMLITGSFYFYAQLTLRIVNATYLERAQLLIAQNIETIHYASDVPDSMKAYVKKLSNTLKPEELRDDTWKFIPVDTERSPERRASEPFEHEAYDSIVLRNEPSFVYKDTKSLLYHVFQPVVAADVCLQCHQAQAPIVKAVGDRMGVARVTFPLEATQANVAKNNAILLIMAIVTATLAMLAALTIVRYVIVKPVMHLKDVSDAIAHGELDQRADIRTGDEFQELSHAFNRMLRQLLSTQDELRLVNTDLDGKVDELARANLSLHEMNKIKNEFLATMSHELRTPLNSILGFSDVLADAPNLSDKQRKYLQNIRTSGQNLLILINDILDLANIEAGRMKINVVEFSMEDLIDRLTLSMRPAVEKKNIDMQWSVDETLPIITQDVGKLQQILFNLLSNAVKFTPEGGRIRVAAQHAPGNRFDLVVADSGIGIPLEDQTLIFEKFRQGSNLRGSDSLTREYEGTGLGLSIVQELSKLLGGEVFLESEFGKGSTFTVRLPIELSQKSSFEEVALVKNAPSDLMRQAASLGVAGQRDAG